MDAETGELHEGGLTAGQRSHDLDVARTNIAGEIMDLEASGRLEDGIDAIEIADRLVAAYTSLWSALTEEESFSSAEAWRINERVQRLNDLGFDIGEMAITTDGTGSHVSIQPKVVDAGHHQRRLIRLTGLDVEENQARRLLNDLDSYRAMVTRPGLDEEMIAHEWLTRVFEPVVKAIPAELRAKLEPAEVFHHVLEHRWYMSQQRESAVPISEVLTSYINDVLRHRRDEATIMGPLTETLTIPQLTPDGRPSGTGEHGASTRAAEADSPDSDGDADEVDWRDLV